TVQSIKSPYPLSLFEVPSTDTLLGGTKGHVYRGFSGNNTVWSLSYRLNRTALNDVLTAAKLK
ncbi:MAG: hypothetical protein R8J85_09810, partial [Mariprofundales bacterium]